MTMEWEVALVAGACLGTSFGILLMAMLSSKRGEAYEQCEYCEYKSTKMGGTSSRHSRGSTDNSTGSNRDPVCEKDGTGQEQTYVSEPVRYA